MDGKILSEQKKRYSLLCPHCKKNIAFELSTEELSKYYVGETAKITLASHGEPAHSVDVYIDRDELIRSASANFESVQPKLTLQNTYITDGTSVLNPQEGKALGITVIPFTLSINDGPHRKFNEELFFSEVYENLKANNKVKSRPVTTEAYLEAFRNCSPEKPTIVLTISARFSAAYANAQEAKKIFAKERPDIAKNIYIIDSQTSGPMLKLMIIKAIALDEAGQSLEEIIEYLNWIREKHVAYIYIDSLNALRKADRIGRVTTLFGNLLGLKPIIVENENGVGDLKAFKTVRSKKDAIKEIVKAIHNQFGFVELEGVIFYGINIEDAEKIREELIQDSKIEEDDFTMDFVGTGVAVNLSFDILGIALYPKL